MPWRGESFDLKLLFAAQYGDHKAAEVAELLAARAQPDVISRSGQTPLLAAIASGSERISSLLLDAHAHPDGVEKADVCTPLVEATSRGQTAVVRHLLTAAANPGLVSKGKTKQAGQTALHAACFRDDAETVILLLHAKASVHKKDRHDLTPLAWTRSDEVSQLLLSKKALAEAENWCFELSPDATFGHNVLRVRIEAKRAYDIIKKEEYLQALRTFRQHRPGWLGVWHHDADMHAFVKDKLVLASGRVVKVSAPSGAWQSTVGMHLCLDVPALELTSERCQQSRYCELLFEATGVRCVPSEESVAAVKDGVHFVLLQADKAVAAMVESIEEFHSKLTENIRPLTIFTLLLPLKTAWAMSEEGLSDFVSEALSNPDASVRVSCLKFTCSTKYTVTTNRSLSGLEQVISDCFCQLAGIEVQVSAALNEIGGGRSRKTSLEVSCVVHEPDKADAVLAGWSHFVVRQQFQDALQDVEVEEMDLVWDGILCEAEVRISTSNDATLPPPSIEALTAACEEHLQEEDDEDHAGSRYPDTVFASWQSNSQTSSSRRRQSRQNGQPQTRD
eukprot:TRINITY_DN48870_c0_g1_i2.p1 TRINITY_DN48870_c0_g1~~TRINITY_DN48870_c0_g1_i2.p1  ORF type:complete len:562 (+),score=96.37 TRINITY_DN48870_c0_g1_i2:160-1845(+)